MAYNLFIGIIKSDLSTLNRDALYDKRQTLFIFKYSFKYSIKALFSKI
jgi:hypothetical protein